MPARQRDNKNTVIDIATAPASGSSYRGREGASVPARTYPGSGPPPLPGGGVHHAAVQALERSEVVTEDVLEHPELGAGQLGFLLEHEPRHALGAWRRGEGTGVRVVLGGVSEPVDEVD